MPRPEKDTEPISTRIDRKKRDRLAEMVIAMGFSYTRKDAKTGELKIQPLWGEWLEAIADVDIAMFKKVDPPS
jgi:hypothetical protein